MSPKPPAQPVADSHDLIRVQGARENNLKDVSIEIPKRRLTVFTGVSGSGKSSLVFDTIAAESQRLINETYSAFLQGFMPNLARPEVDVLDGLTTAIIVDQERMGCQRPLDGRHRHGRPRDAPDPVQPAGEAAHRAGDRLLVQRPDAASERGDDGRQGQGGADRGAQRRLPGRHVPTLRRDGLDQRHRSGSAVRREPVARGGRDHHPRLQGRRLGRAYLHRVGLPRPGQADPEVHEEGAARLPRQGTDQGEGRGDQHDVRGPDPEGPEVVPLQGQGGDAAARPRVRGAGGDVHHLSRLRRHPAQRSGPVVEDRGDQHRRCLLDADQRPRRVAARSRRAVGGAAADGAGGDPRLVRGDRARLPQPRPPVRHAVRAARHSAPR